MPRGVSRFLLLLQAHHLLMMLSLSWWEGGPLAPLSASAHIHVAPEYFHRCDSIQSSAVMLTGGAWLLQGLGASSPLCRGRLGTFLGCGVYTQMMHQSGIERRRLEALEEGSKPDPEPQLTAFFQKLFGWGGPDDHAGKGSEADAAPAAATEHFSKRGTGGPRIVKVRKGAPQAKGWRQHAGIAVPQPPSTKEQQQQEKQQPRQEEGVFSFFWQFVNSVASSSSLVAATELGDRTFFLAALLALRYSRLLVFGATCAALFLASAVSSAAGYCLQHAASIPLIPSPIRALLRGGAIVGFASAAALLLFGLWHLYKARAALLAHRTPLRGSSSYRVSLQGPSQRVPQGALDSPGVPLEAVPPTTAAAEGIISAEERCSGGSSEETSTFTPGAPKGGGPDDASVSTRLSPADDFGEGEEICEQLEEAQEDVDRLFVGKDSAAAATCAVAAFPSVGAIPAAGASRRAFACPAADARGVARGERESFFSEEWCPC